MRRLSAAKMGESLTRAGERVAGGVDKAFDLKRNFDVALAIESLPGSTFIGFELGKLGFPKAEDVGFDFANAGYIANFEIETVGD